MLITFILLYSMGLYAENFIPEHIEKLKTIKDISYDDLKHPYKGCPENSICNEETGKLYLKFLDVLEGEKLKEINQFKNTHGAPITYLSSLKANNEIAFKSRCRHHNLKDQEPIYLAKSFMNKIEQKDKVHFDEIFIDDQKYLIPIDQSPLYIKNKKLVLMVDLEEKYFFIAIARDGTFEIIKPNVNELKKAREYLAPIKDCKKEIKFNKNIFLGHQCRQILNFDTNKPITFTSTWSCP